MPIHKKDNSEEGRALLCIPDISGFTRFMAETNLKFSRKIIPSLLRNIVSSNNLSLHIGEIEGDAILFYRFGALPSLKELVDQCKSFYVNFVDHLEELKQEFPDDFAKYISSNKLSLKIILHAADITTTYIEGHVKLIGEDIVVVHKLLKNSVEEAEYLLLTDRLLSNYKQDEIARALDWTTLEKGEDTYEYIGRIRYRYVSLEPLQNAIEKEDAKRAS